MSFTPTYLYIKRHTVTGMLYFGKSTRDEDGMIRYSGSGKYWKQHIKKHGVHSVETVWYCLFTDKNDMIKFATQFSNQENISDSPAWANLRAENGIDGFPKGVIHAPWSDERRNAQSIRRKGVSWGTHSAESKEKMSLGRSGKGTGELSKEHRDKISAALVGRAKPPRSAKHQSKLTGSFKKGQKSWNAGITGLTRSSTPVTCPHCGKSGHPGGMKRWHFDQCPLLKKDSNHDS